MSDPVFDYPRERELARAERPSSIALLRRREFRILARPLFGVAACLTAAVGLAGALLAARLVQGAAPERAQFMYTRHTRDPTSLPAAVEATAEPVTCL